MSTTEDHMYPADQLGAGEGLLHELLAGLTDAQLAEQLEYHRVQRAAATNPHTRWMMGNHVAAAMREQDNRSGE
jgi:hypothetical protein